MFQKKTVMTIAVIGVLAFLAAIPEVAANTPNITAGLEKVSADDLAKKILNIAIGCAALAGVIAAVMLTYLGFKLKTGSEKDRAETKEHVVWVFLGLALAGFAAVIAGFAAFMIKGD